MSEPPHKKSRSDGAVGAVEPTEKKFPFDVETDRDNDGSGKRKETGNKKYVATKDDGSSCSITINYSKDGWSATIMMFECNDRERYTRGGGDGKKLLLNVLKYIKEEYPSVFLIDLVVSPTGDDETNDFDKLIDYYRGLGFKSIDAEPSMMSQTLEGILMHNNRMGGGKKRTRKTKKKKSISKKVKKRRIKTKRKRDKRRNKYTKRK